MQEDNRILKSGSGIYHIDRDILPELRADAPKFLMEIIAKYGTVVPLKIGTERVILAAHPDAVEQVCRGKASNYVKTKYVDKLKPILGEGLATSNGEQWSASRKLIQPMLKQSQVATMIAQMDQVIAGTVESWADGSVELSEASHSLALRVISRIMFGDDQKEEAQRLVQAQHIVYRYISDSIWEADEPGTPRHDEYQKALTSVKDTMGQIIAERRSGVAKDDFLQVLLSASDPDTGRGFSDEQVFDEVMTMFVGGHETAGTTMGWLWQVVALRPDLQERMRSEIFEHIPLDQTPSLAQLNKLTLTTAVLKETMRLWPAGWWFARTAVEDDNIMGIPVRSGDSIIISEYVTQRLPGLWANPETFDETRFIGKPLPHQFAYLPFGAGPRTCPGRHFAMAEMLLMIARALTRFELKATHMADYEALFTLRVAGAAPVEIKPLERTLFVQAERPVEHALIKSLLQMRKQVFVDQLGWQRETTLDGCEIDQFDTADTLYGALVAGGQIKSFSRQLPTTKPTLIYDVFGHLIDDPVMKKPPVDGWEGSRFACHPDLDARESSVWVKRYLSDLMAEARSQGVPHILTVSTPVLERVLKRAGMQVGRLGDVKIGEDGHAVVGLVLATGFVAQDLRVLFKPAPARLHTPGIR